uniref:Uncharacterized protein n=1 Tax=Glossina pallidipes TaxID=7398 RepID=A0A1A9ZAP8_GLOPL
MSSSVGSEELVQVQIYVEIGKQATRKRNDNFNISLICCGGHENENWGIVLLMRKVQGNRLNKDTLFCTEKFLLDQLFWKIFENQFLFFILGRLSTNHKIMKHQKEDEDKDVILALRSRQWTILGTDGHEQIDSEFPSLQSIILIIKTLIFMTPAVAGPYQLECTKLMY